MCISFELVSDFSRHHFEQNWKHELFVMHSGENAELLHVKFLLDKFNNVYSQISSGPNVGPGPGRYGATLKIGGRAGRGHSKIERGGAGPYFLSHNMGPNGAPDLAPCCGSENSIKFKFSPLL